MVLIHCCGVEGLPGGREGGDGDHSLSLSLTRSWWSIYNTSSFACTGIV